ncbi:unnamed protein product [Ilex paraguariensis]|uniref:Uncharacterized protein n=1 Tax=Ilex paraguariensis TaxID=185542 RepID=A0ABC8S5Q6_9AQUA
MSRCFPFPPPGYEKKARSDDTDLLKEVDTALAPISHLRTPSLLFSPVVLLAYSTRMEEKEKSREKRSRKEKRDKEKKDSTEKRKKGRTEGKHKEKKDRKEKYKEKNEKHRDKRNDKEERDNDKEKSSISVEKKICCQSDGYNGEKLQQKEEWGKDSRRSSEKKPSVHVYSSNGEKAIRNSFLAEETEDSKFVQELGRRIRNEENGTGRTDWKKDEGMDRFAVTETGMLSEGKEKNKDKKVVNRKMDRQGIKAEVRFCRNAMVQNLVGIVQNKVEEMPRPVEKNVERKMERKEKSKEREGVVKRGDKRMDKGREKKSHSMGNYREKEKKKAEDTKEKSENKKSEQNKFKDVIKNDLIGVSHNNASHLPKDCYKNAFNKESLKRRKDFETNGFLHDSEVRPTKLPRPTLHPFIENGRKLESCQSLASYTSDRQGAANNHKVDNKEIKVNGVIEAKPLFVSIPKPLSANTLADQIAERTSKPPHPDTKYLSHVFSVPNLEWSDFDDQEWLFSSKYPRSKKPEVVSVSIKKEQQVWAEALQIESADVCALPFVIPQ